MRKFPLVLAALLMGGMAAHADSLVTTRPAGTDSVTWSQLGSSYTAIPNPFDFTTTLGVQGSGSYANPDGIGRVLQDGNGFNGNFTQGDYLNYNLENGLVTLNFDQGYTQIGAQIDANGLAPSLPKSVKPAPASPKTAP